MSKYTKILCYVLVFDQVEIIQKTLSSLVKHADVLDIVIIENPSKNTVKIKKLIESYSGHIKRHYLFKDNITSRAYDTILEHERNIIEKYKYIVVTDGDVTSNDNWIREERLALSLNPSLFCIGLTFSKDNLPVQTFPESIHWVPQDMSRSGIGYQEALTGIHYVMFRSAGLIDFLDYKLQHDINFIDSNIKEYVYNTLHKRWGRTKKSMGIHLTWDLYHDLNHPYTKLKTGKSFQDTWYHKNTSTFDVMSFN